MGNILGLDAVWSQLPPWLNLNLGNTHRSDLMGIGEELSRYLVRYTDWRLDNILRAHDQPSDLSNVVDEHGA